MTSEQKFPDIVISGVSGRYPNADNVREFEDNLYNKVDMVDADGDRRWKQVYPNVPHRFGKMNQLEKFDAPFFSILKRVADGLDPQCRILLEKAYEAVLDAGICPKAIFGTRTAVIVGCLSADAENMTLYDAPRRDGFVFNG